MKYSNFSIEENRRRLVETATKDSTPKRYAGLMFEAAEQIAQLRFELEKALQKRAEVDDDFSPNSFLTEMIDITISRKSGEKSGQRWNLICYTAIIEFCIETNGDVQK